MGGWGYGQRETETQTDSKRERERERERDDKFFIIEGGSIEVESTKSAT